MDWIFDNLQIVVFLAAGVAYWLNSMRQAKEEARQQQEEDRYEPREEEIYSPAPHTEVFLPPPVAPPPVIGGAPPPLPGQPMARQKRGFPEASPTPLRPQSPHGQGQQAGYQAELERQKALEERLLSLRQNRDKRGSGAAATQRLVASRSSAKENRNAEKNTMPGIRSQLRNPAEARRAIVLREILGTPVGMR